MTLKNSEDLNELSKCIYYAENSFNNADLKSYSELLIVYYKVRSFNRNTDKLLSHLRQLRTNIDVIVMRLDSHPCFLQKYIGTLTIILSNPPKEVKVSLFMYNLF